MNSKFFLSFTTLALAALSHAQYYEYTNAVSFSGITANAGVPTLVGSTGTQAFYCVGTDINAKVFIPAPANTSSSFSGYPGISYDGTKINVGIDSNAFGDATVHNVLAQFDVTTGVTTAFGALNYYSSSGTPRLGASSWGISGDGLTVTGQAYMGSSTTSYATNRVAPMLGTIAGTTNLLGAGVVPTSNGRAQCANFDGTYVGGYSSSSAAGFYWNKVGGVWQPGVAMLAPYPLPTSATIKTIPAPVAISADGRLMATSGSSAIGQQACLFDRVTGKAQYVPLMTGSLQFRATTSGLSSYGDVMTGFYVDFANSSNLALNVGFVWTPTMGQVRLNDLVDNYYPGTRNAVNLIRPAAISPDGEWVAGVMSLPATGPAKTFAVHLGTALRGDGTLLDFIGDQSNETLNFTLKDSSGTTVDSWTGKLDPRGHFCWLSKVDLGSADFHLFVKGSHWLAKSILVNTSTKNSLNFSLTNGDVHDDNVVDLTDYTELVVAFDALLVDPNNGNASSANWQASADLNGDGGVDLTDYIIVATNFNMVGDN